MYISPSLSPSLSFARCAARIMSFSFVRSNGRRANIAAPGDFNFTFKGIDVIEFAQEVQDLRTRPAALAALSTIRFLASLSFSPPAAPASSYNNCTYNNRESRGDSANPPFYFSPFSLGTNRRVSSDLQFALEAIAVIIV